MDVTQGDAADLDPGPTIIEVSPEDVRRERQSVEALLARQPHAIVVEIGLPHWRPAGSATYVATYGAARVNVEAAAEALYSGPRRGVEQSGSSPGS